MNKEIELSDKKYFNIFIGNRILKKDIFQTGYKIPVYSANVFKPFGYLKDSNIQDFSCDYLIWGIDGNFEFNLIPKGTIFATTDHCGAIRIVDKNILPEFVLHILRLQAHLLGFDRSLRSSLKNMEKISISIPVDSKGNFDTAKQLVIADKYKKVWKIKSSINQKMEEISDLNINIDVKGAKKVKLEELFEFPETNSGITKDFCDKNKGDIPVYGCSKSDIAVLGNIKEDLLGIKFYENSLTWNRNGSVGHVFYRSGKFSTNEDHRVLALKETLKDKIDLFYIKYTLENEIKKLGFGFTNKLGKAKMKDIEIDIPTIEKDGKKIYDLLGQQYLSKKYVNIYDIKNKLLGKLQSLSTVECEIT